MNQFTPNRPDTRREPVLARLDPDDREWLDQQARHHDLNRSQMLRRIVRDARLNAVPPEADADAIPETTSTSAMTTLPPAPHRHLRTVIRPKVGNRPALFGCKVPGCEWTREDT